ncbi:Abhydrolase 1 domain containing protein [Asbolus verrucosus]|uniref:Abhydrolase 1 domain containing protein n=1 Tax=Asbolus verrucosus TaxID=1661398 RepID=A0A482VWY9_ASBVE|nr:Abhydrolase 1 domain containing protein [Asbolus verrucosus]
MHGLGSSANGWIVPGPNHSLAFLLADRGYDVWIGNARGTSYSKKHVRYDPERNPEKFWDFSWHEIGHYDLYSMINYIMNVTQQSQMFYIGHSQGCTCYFALMSTRPEMNKHVNLMVALAPGVFFGSPAITPEFFAFSVFHQIDEHWTLIQQTIPDSGSIKQNLHYIQIILTGEFRQYHLGREENLRKYGLELPLLYSLNRVSSPVTLFAGEKDTQARPENVQKLGTILPNVAELHVVSEFSHVDFLAADSTVELVFDEIFALMYNYAK